MLTKLIAKYYTIICDDNVKVCNRKDFCIFFGIYILTFLILLIVITIFKSFKLPNIFYLPILLCSIVMDILLFILSIKRLHDANLSGLFILIPLIGLVLLFSPSSINKNKYNKQIIENENKEENEELECFIKKLQENTKKEQ